MDADHGPAVSLTLIHKLQRAMMRRQMPVMSVGRGKEIKNPCTTCHGTGHEK